MSSPLPLVPVDPDDEGAVQRPIARAGIDPAALPDLSGDDDLPDDEKDAGTHASARASSDEPQEVS